MTTVDILLTDLYQEGIEKLPKEVPTRDKKILQSLSRQIISGNFLTENQGKLLVKIFTENKIHLGSFLDKNLSLLDQPLWSKPFRVIEQIRKIYINKDKDSSLVIEFTYNKHLKQLISNLSKDVDGQLISVSPKQYTLPLTEKNVFKVVSAFQNRNFSIAENVQQFYREISQILKEKKNPFIFESLENEKIKDCLTKELSGIDANNQLLVNDRKIRFQYTVTEENTEKSLTSILANRTHPKVWINSNSYPLEDLIKSLIELRRLPVLFVFNGYESSECLKNLTKMSESLKLNNLESNVGIYFRFDNHKDSDRNFNQTISTLGYNQQLALTTEVAGIANNKLPKFLLKNKWYPRSVISFSNNFRNNKTSVYCNAVDLIVYYNEKQPLEGTVNAIV